MTDNLKKRLNDALGVNEIKRAVLAQSDEQLNRVLDENRIRFDANIGEYNDLINEVLNMPDADYEIVLSARSLATTYLLMMQAKEKELENRLKFLDDGER
jgi:hypothetical protein